MNQGTNEIYEVKKYILNEQVTTIALFFQKKTS